MKLTDLLPIAKEEKREFYWSLVIEPGWVQTGIWSIADGTAQVISISPGAAWEVEDDLVSAADTALSAAIQNLPEEFGEPSKTVFGLPNSWVDKGEIKEEYLEKIKKICGELSLTPTGFVVVPEAIAHLIKSEEGAPASAVILGIGKDALEISVFKLGKLVGTSEVARSISLAEDAIEGLARFSAKEPFPSRFLIYDGKEGELEEAKQSLLDANWDEDPNIKFLHTPKIEIIKPDQKILATSLAGASEIGQVSKVLEIFENKEEETVQESETNVVTPQEEIKAEDLGFVVNEDISKVPEVPEPAPSFEEPPKIAETPVRRRVPKFSFSKILGSLPKMPSFAGKNFITLGIILAFLFTIIFAAWWFLPSANISIFVAPKTLEETVSLTIDPEASGSDFGKGVVAGKALATGASGEKTISTTGTKLVGEKAIGVARVQNGLASPINLPAGTILSSTNDLRFTTTKTASVSAALSPSSPGVSNVDVTAANIGAEYNLAKDESFKVGNYPKADVDAVSVDNFAGGSSRQITAVSAEDQQRVEGELTEELVRKAKETLSGQISADEVFLESAITTSPSSRDFSHRVGDESANLKLSLTISATGLTVNKKELFEYAKGILGSKIPGGYLLTEDEMDIDFEVVDSDGGVYEVEGRIVASLLPEINKDEIAKKISGKYPRLVEAFLTTIPGFTRADMRINPRLPGFLRTLPHITKRINIEIESEK